MVTCETCGCTDFYNEDGYMYCNECQTQSQQYYEQDTEAPGMVTHVKKRPTKKKAASQSLTICDLWTSWDAFNYILFGMTQELQNLSFAPKNLKETVLKLWACQLQKSEVAFVSRMQEKKPKLGLLYRRRDSKILYGFVDLIPRRRQTRKRKRLKSDKSLSMIKKKFFQKQLEECLSSQSSAAYLNDSIETLTPCSSKSVSECESESTTVGNLRDVFALSDNVTYKKFKELTKNPACKNSKRGNVNYFSKSKLLAIIHLALLMIGSVIQLSDILRFIRESHLSFAKVTQFLPEEFKLSKGDISFIETIRDQNMPTHLKQRKVGRSLARALSVFEISLPDMPALINRYCVDLNLPDVIAKYSLVVSEHIDIEKMCTLKRTRYLPNFEAVAMASIIFVMKLLFGLDGITELILSDLAEKINSLRSAKDKKLFVFNDWQKHIECRKALLQCLHYPTEEKLKSNPIGKSKGYLDILMKENKDEDKEQRFKKYTQYYLNPRILNSVKDVLESLNEPINRDCFEFPSSLTPCSTYIDIILEVYRDGTEKMGSKCLELPKLPPLTLSILNEKFKEQSIDYITKPTMYTEKLTGENFGIIQKSKSDLIKIKLTSEDTASVEDDVRRQEDADVVKFPQFSKVKKVVFLKNPFDYWILKNPSTDEKSLYEFKSDVFSKMSVNFRWLLVECSQMLEMNTRELYKELAFVEMRMKALVKKITKRQS